MAPVEFPPRPSLGLGEWYDEREVYDQAIEDSLNDQDTRIVQTAFQMGGVLDELNGRLSSSELSAAIRAKVAPTTLYVDDYAQVGDVSDQEAGQRAIDAAKDLGSPCVIQFPARDILLHKFISITGTVADLKIRGYGIGATTFRAQAGAGAVTAALIIPQNASGAIDRTVFEDFSIHGGFVSAPGDDLARNGRVFGPDTIRAGIKVSGRRNPASTAAWAEVRDLTIQRVRVFGTTGLPVLVEGIYDFKVMDCTFERCLDFGVTWTEGVLLQGCTARWSGDNGFSLSRGNTNVRALGNFVYGAWFWGLWVAGWDADSGAKGFSLVGNTVEYCGSGGVAAYDAPSDGIISGNTFRNFIRGGEGTGTYGVGIFIAGKSVTEWADSISVVGNVLIDCALGGILVRSYSRNIKVSDNLIIRPGTELDHTGATIGTSDPYQNYGVSIPMQPAEASRFGLIVIQNNTSIDDRNVPWMNFGTYTHPDIDSVVARSGNRSFNQRSTLERLDIQGAIQTVGATIGKKGGVTAILALEGVTAAGRAVMYRINGSDRNSIRVVNSTGMLLTSYADEGEATDVAKVTRTNPQFEILTSLKNARYATGSRPSASTLGSGTQIFDTTLGRPIWSNGTAWINAAGVVV